MKKKDKGRSGKRPLRGETLIRTVRTQLAKMVNLSPENRKDRIGISNLARKLGISRQSIYDNNLDQEVEDYAALQRSNDKIKTEAATLRRPLEERLKLLEKEKEDLIKIIDGWIQRWVTVEHNAKMHGYDADLLFAPLSLPLRKALIFKRGGKRYGRKR